jgi:peptide-methionine (S)-S-oxide reductase
MASANGIYGIRRSARHASIHALAASVFLVLVSTLRPSSADSPLALPALDDAKAASALESAVLAGGCFWGMQAVFEHLKGVHRVLAGYSGGQAVTAHYYLVGTGRTGHAEAVQITFDPRVVSYGEILRVFFSVAHDPTELDRQGPDVGSQYRSVIFYADDAQRRTALAYISQLERSRFFPRPIVTRVDALRGFYPAEGYHQDYLVHNLSDPYIVYNDLPKLAQFRALLPQLYREQPSLVTVASRR